MGETYSLKKVVIFTLITLVIFVAFYGITVLVLDNKKDNNDSSEQVDTPTSIQYEEIVVGSIFKQNENAYYILATLSSDTNESTYISSLKTYSASDNALKAYTIDLDNSFNKKYLAEESNFNNSLPVFKTSTLLKIVDKQIVEVYEADEVNNQLNILTSNIKE